MPYVYPRSDHCDGQNFHNPGTRPPRHGWLDLLRWRLSHSRSRWPKWVENDSFPPPPQSVPRGSAAITFINHSTFLISLPEAVVLTDPIFSERCSPVSWAGPKRVRGPGIPLAELPRPDVVLLSHNHYDHMDLPSLRALHERFAPHVVTTLGNTRTLARIGIAASELDWWQHIAIGGLRITATPARHFAARTPFDRNRALWGGFMVEDSGGRILFAGDSGTGPHWRDIALRLGSPDVALLPIGAYEPRWLMASAHTDPAETVQAHLDLGARHSIGMHFGTFQLTDEAIDAPLHALAAARQAAGLPAEAFATLGFGETRSFALSVGKTEALIGNRVSAP